MLDCQLAEFPAGVEPLDKKRILLVRPRFAYIRRQRLLTLEAQSAFVERPHRKA